MSLSQANSPAKRLYLAIQFMYLSKNPKDNYAIYAQLVRVLSQTVPDAKPFLDRINNQIINWQPLQGSQGSAQANRARKGPSRNAFRKQGL
jgi:hypothetical protein